MIHSFYCLGKYLLLDVESGAVHQVDELIHDIVRLPRELTNSQITDKLSAKYDAVDIAEALAELCELREQGLLDTPDNNAAVAEKISSNGAAVKAMCLHVAHDCNMRCQYCFASTGDFHGERMLMPLETAKAALDFLAAHSGGRKNLEVDFFGGEPMMNIGVVRDTVAYGRELEKKWDKQFRFTITTNCLVLDEDTVDFFNREMVNVVISLDGRREVHDRMRKTVNGKPSFDIILNNAKRIADFRGQQRYYVRGTYTGYNLDFAKDVLFLADQGFEQVSVEPVVSEASEPYAIKEKHVEQICGEYEKLAEEYLRRRATDKWFHFFHFTIDMTGGPCLPKRVSGCGAGNEYVAVTPEGDIYPCHQFVGMPEKKMGSVHTGAFDREMQREYKACNVLTKDKCRDCWAKYYCSGGCAANAYKYSGDIYKPYEMSCTLQKKRTECALAIYAIERERNEQK